MNWRVDTSWTDERVERLKALWKDGLSASQIAKDLGGVTRNAVVGKVHRLGLSASGGFSRPAPAIPSARPAPPPPQRTRLHPAGNRVYLTSEDRPLPPPKPDEIAVAPRAWETREFGECAFPIEQPDGEILSCCNPGPERATWCYCADHWKLMHQEVATGKGWSEERRAKQAALMRQRNHQPRRAA